MMNVRIKAGKKFTHAGKELASGSQLALRDDKANWLIQQGVAEAIGSSRSPGAEVMTPPAVAERTLPQAPVVKRPAQKCCGWFNK